MPISQCKQPSSLLQSSSLQGTWGKFSIVPENHAWKQGFKQIWPSDHQRGMLMHMSCLLFYLLFFFWETHYGEVFMMISCSLYIPRMITDYIMQSFMSNMILEIWNLKILTHILIALACLKTYFVKTRYSTRKMKIFLQKCMKWIKFGR